MPAMERVSPGSNSSTGRCEKIFFVRKSAPAGKEGAVPVLAPDIEALDVIAMLMSNEKSRDVVSREPQFCHAL